MALKNTSDSYGWLAKTLHWLIALLIITLWCVGSLMGGLENSPTKFQVYFFHKSFGIAVLILAVARISWRLVNVQPAHSALPRWQVIAAEAVHYALYACMFLMPLSGWAMSSAAGRPVDFFGLFILPDFVAPDEALAKVLRHRHGQIGDAILILVCAHVGAALLHHFYYKDNILKRMLPARRK